MNPRPSMAVVDSDDDIEFYNQSRHEERVTNKSRKNTMHSALEGVGQQHQDDSEGSDLDGQQLSPDDVKNGDADENGFDSDDEDDPRHPYYNYGTEKADVQADSKLIYQRHRMDTKSESESGGSPYLLSKSLTMPLETQFEGLGLHRNPSLSSRKSRQSNKNNVILPPPSLSHDKEEPFPSLQDHAADNKAHLQNMANITASPSRNASHYPTEEQDSLLSGQNVHGKGAGFGVGEGPGGMAKNDASIVSEVHAICDKIKHILDLRQAYMTVSLQNPGDNPKDDPDWKVYPDPPEPVWTAEKARPPPNQDPAPASASSSMYIGDHRSALKDGLRWSSTTSMAALEAQNLMSPTTGKKRRKAGTNIGEDFDFSECDIPGKDHDSFTYRLDDWSIFQVYDENDKPIVNVPTLRDYYMALDQILDIASDGPSKSFAYRRMQYLEGRYNLYSLLNEYEEVADTKKVPHRDFYNVRKVDTHVHHSACMNQKHLLRFIKSKMKRAPDDLVLERDGKTLTLREVFESINLTAYDLSIDTLDMHAHTDSFHRFDKFNLKYNPVGQSRLRDIFLKTDNFIKGRYLAEITREVISDLESSKYQMVEWRISIYGRNLQEWDKLAAWVVDNKLFSHNVRWLIQIPRLFAVYKQVNNMDNFEELLRNIFQPLFEVTMDPTTHPKLHVFLQRVIGFDSVDDESKTERRFYRKFPTPKMWNTKQNPPYGYWIYHLFANMTSLNAWRKHRGFNTFLLRPHCGEAGDTDHLAAAILCCHSISHGITLRKVPLLQYVFYLNQIGIAMSPLSNNALFLTYDRNPFISYFRKGLNVSLSTDDPLQFAFTKEPLIEEYSVAAQIYKLGAIDMCELAKHSVDQCGFELALKQRWLGKYCYLPGVLGNDVRKCNVPDIREAFRHETLKGEHAFIARYTDNYTHLERVSPSMPDPHDSATPITEVYKTLESPRQWYTTLAGGVTPAQLARNPDAPQSQSQDPTPIIKQPSSAQQTERNANRGSRSNTLSKATSAQSEQYESNNNNQDRHVSGSEPRAFPGLVRQFERRRNSLRQSMNGSMHEGSVTSDRMSASQQLDPALEKYRSTEDEQIKHVEDSD